MKFTYSSAIYYPAHYLPYRRYPSRPHPLFLVDINPANLIEIPMLSLLPEPSIKLDDQKSTSDEVKFSLTPAAHIANLPSVCNTGHVSGSSDINSVNLCARSKPNPHGWNWRQSQQGGCSSAGRSQAAKPGSMYLSDNCDSWLTYW